MEKEGIWGQEGQQVCNNCQKETERQNKKQPESGQQEAPVKRGWECKKVALDSKEI